MKLLVTCVLILSVSSSACASGTSTPECSPFVGARQVTSSAPALTPGLEQGIADLLLLLPSPEPTIHNVVRDGDIAFVVFSFSEMNKRKRAFGSFVRRGNRWINDQLASDLWDDLPAPCSNRFELISLETAGVSCTGGFYRSHRGSRQSEEG